MLSDSVGNFDSSLLRFEGVSVRILLVPREEIQLMLAYICESLERH